MSRLRRHSCSTARCASSGATALVPVRAARRSACRRWRGRGLIVAQVYNTGARSLIIIMLSGLFVGMVLGLQGYELLQRFGSEDALGIAAALGLLQGARAR